MQRVDTWLTDTPFVNFTAQDKLHAPKAFWMHLFPATENHATLALVRFGDDPREYIITPGKPLPLIDVRDPSPVARDIFVRVPYGPQVPATFLFQEGNPFPATVGPAEYAQKYPIDYTALANGGGGDANNILTVPCRGMKSGILHLAVTDAAAANLGAVVSVFAGSEDRLGAGLGYTYRKEILPALVLAGNDAAWHRNRIVSFRIPPGCDWLRVRGWRYFVGVANTVQGSLTLSSADGDNKIATQDSSAFNINAAGATYWLVCSSPVLDIQAARSTLRYRYRNDPASATNLTFSFVGVYNIGKENNTDDHRSATHASLAAIVPNTEAFGNVGPFGADCWMAMVIPAGLGVNTGSINIAAT